MEASKPTLLVVGAGGFIGGFIASEGLRRGYDVTVAVRQSTSRRYLSDERLNFAVLDYDDPDALATQLQEEAPQSGAWDYVIYNLGATKCANFADFNRINCGYLPTFCEALADKGMMPRRLLFMSSLSALGNPGDRDYAPIDASTPARPNTRYGLSKIKAETYLEAHPDIPWTIFRPTGVYGPHERDYLMMIKSIDRHWDFGVGYRKQMLTFIYVSDLAAAVFDALQRGKTGKSYLISEPKAYTQSQFRRIVARELDKKWVIPVRLPLWAVKIASIVAEKYGVAKMKPSTLNSDKYRIMKQRNWNVDVSDAVADFGFNPQFDLERGIKATVEAYRKEQAEEKEANKKLKK